jgi:hypothetical protein
MSALLSFLLLRHGTSFLRIEFEIIVVRGLGIASQKWGMGQD